MDRGAWWVTVHGFAKFLQVRSESDSFLPLQGENPCYHESFPTRLSSRVCVLGGGVLVEPVWNGFLYVF